MFARGHTGGGSDQFFGKDMIPASQYYLSNPSQNPANNVDWLKSLPGNSEGWGLPTGQSTTTPPQVTPNGSVEAGPLEGLAGVLSPETIMALQGLNGYMPQQAQQSQPMAVQPTMPAGTWGNW